MHQQYIRKAYRRQSQFFSGRIQPQLLFKLAKAFDLWPIQRFKFKECRINSLFNSKETSHTLYTTLDIV